MIRPGRTEPRPRALLLFCLMVAAVSATVPVDDCPDYIDCAKRGRHFCQQGSSHCGPCLASLEEDEEGRCVSPKKRQHHESKETSLTDLDQEIDYLSSIIAKQQVSGVEQPGGNQPGSSSSSGHQSQSDGRKSVSTPKNVSHSNTARPTINGPSARSQHTPVPPKPATNAPGRAKPVAVPFPRDSLLILITSLCIIMGTVALIMAVICWVRLQKETHLAQKVDYPAFHGEVTSSYKNISSGDKNLAHSAQMYHYQHQKQQMLSMEKHKSETKVSESGVSDEENEEGDFTVYECPGLAPTGEMEVKNPLFDDFTLHRNHK
ncbi:neural proliferation differentiation and control protein 1a [Brachyhypopomus gauderio]|uniref:neural proliferation differentiation and control protein 1a n=1 Tax=Brachyhypopomus gauderio TaxID=698409 RepID=UPI004042EA3E